MKKFSDKLFWYAIIVAIIIWIVWGVIYTFGGLDSIRLIGNGSLFIGFLKLPLCLFGGVQLIRGFYSVIGKDTEAIAGAGKSSYTLWILYIALTIAGIMFFIDAYYVIK